MKKKLLIIAFVSGLICSVTISKAQDARFSLGAELGLPMGDFGDAQSIGFGASLRYESPMGDKMGFTITAGYLSFGGKTVTEDVGGVSVDTKTESTYLIPVQAGLKYYFNEQQQGLYAHAMLGVHMYKSVEFEVDPTTYAITSTDKMKAAFSYAPELGYHLDNIDLGLRMNFISLASTDSNGESVTKTSSYLGLRIAYVFGGK